MTSVGRLPIAAAAFVIPAAFLWLVASVYQVGVVLGPWAVDEEGQPRSLLQRHGFWVIAAGTLLYLPMQGSYSLSDPWETHYGEVAREMLARNDWISTWWAQDGWFWSKPVLDFWMQAIAMGIFGVNYRPGMMLAGAEAGRTPWPEWAVRMPVFILTIVALYFLYKGVAKVFGRRAGMIGALILATMPQWYLLAHQTITDMPLELGNTDVIRALLMGVVALTVWALVGVGLGTALTNQVAAIVVLLGFTQFVEPILRIVFAMVESLSAIGSYLPGAAGEAIVGTSFYASAGMGSALLPPWGGVAVLLAYAAITGIVGWLTTFRKDRT